MFSVDSYRAFVGHLPLVRAGLLSLSPLLEFHLLNTGIDDLLNELMSVFVFKGIIVSLALVRQNDVALLGASRILNGISRSYPLLVLDHMMFRRGILHLDQAPCRGFTIAILRIWLIIIFVFKGLKQFIRCLSWPSNFLHFFPDILNFQVHNVLFRIHVHITDVLSGKGAFYREIFIWLVNIKRFIVSRLFLAFDNLRINCFIDWSFWGRLNFHCRFLRKILTLILWLRLLASRECCWSWIWGSFSDLINLFMWLIFLIELLIALLDSMSWGQESCRLLDIQSLGFSAVWRANSEFRFLVSICYDLFCWFLWWYNWRSFSFSRNAWPLNAAILRSKWGLLDKLNLLGWNSWIPSSSIFNWLLFPWHYRWSFAVFPLSTPLCRGKWRRLGFLCRW